MCCILNEKWKRKKKKLVKLWLFNYYLFVWYNYLAIHWTNHSHSPKHVWKDRSNFCYSIYSQMFLPFTQNLLQMSIFFSLSLFSLLHISNIMLFLSSHKASNSWLFNTFYKKNFFSSVFFTFKVSWQHALFLCMPRAIIIFLQIFL